MFFEEARFDAMYFDKEHSSLAPSTIFHFLQTIPGRLLKVSYFLSMKNSGYRTKTHKQLYVS